jgi:hypothetical protein
MRHGAQQNQSGRESHVVRLRYEAGMCAGCTVLAVVRQRASGTVITGTAPARRKPSSFGSSLNRFANKCPLSGAKRTHMFSRGKRNLNCGAVLVELRRLRWAN